MRWRLPILLAATLGFSACSRQEGVPVARVNGKRLMRETLEASMPAELTRFADRDVYVDLARRWIEGELLAQEALARELDQDPRVRRQLEASRREVLAQALLDRVLDSVGEPAQQEIQKHYDTHQQEFIRLEPEVSFLQLTLPDQATALALRTRLTPATFAAEVARLDPARGTALQGQRMYRRADLAPGVAEAVFGLAEGEISAPVQLPGGWSLFQLISRAPAGSLRPFAEVSDRISATLREERRRSRLKDLLAELSRGAKVELHPDALPGALPPPSLPAPSTPRAQTPAAEPRETIPVATPADSVADKPPPAAQPERRAQERRQRASDRMRSPRRATSSPVATPPAAQADGDAPSSDSPNLEN